VPPYQNTLQRIAQYKLARNPILATTVSVGQKDSFPIQLGIGKVVVDKFDKATVGSVPTVYSLLYLL